MDGLAVELETEVSLKRIRGAGAKGTLKAGLYSREGGSDGF